MVGQRVVSDAHNRKVAYPVEGIITRARDLIPDRDDDVKRFKDIQGGTHGTGIGDAGATLRPVANGEPQIGQIIWIDVSAAIAGRGQAGGQGWHIR